MVEPVSAVLGVLVAVGSGTANEAGKQLWETAGALVRRITGREVAAPATATERQDLAASIVAACADRPELLAQFLQLTRGLPGPPDWPAGAPPRLPSAPYVFTDRREILRGLDEESARPFRGRPRTVQLHGPEGIGTTAAVLHWGWRRADRFPDGQLYADVRGATPGETAARLLRRIGTPDDRIPPAAADRVDALRGLLGERRVLVVLDHVTSTAQVRPLVVPGPGVCTVVVARERFAGLGAVHLPLGPLPPRDARRVLTGVAGKAAVAAARATLPAVLDRCAGHPYAL
ncbi:tetratricopeptide repeat protein, partial [Streptomyces sp. SID5785]|nr:tetratricopeptide repeat protein [Streptomyces sp. SID5785]MZD05176.1 tetratricopeptide repeat protein [Streptomyces sp. SID5785]